MTELGIKKNLSYALGAESLQLLQSVLMSIIIPKILGIEQFGFWQLFIFYISYGGFFHLGLLDGIYLKIGGVHIEDIDFRSLSAQMKVLFVWLSLVLFPVAIYGMTISDPNRKIVIVASCLFIILNNILSFHSYLLQCVNNIKTYSVGRFVDMVSFITCLFFLLLGKVNLFLPYVISYFVAKSISLVYYGYNLRSLWWNLGKRVSFSLFLDIYDSIKIGINLLASNIVSMLVLGVGRWMVDKEWGIESFSKISFSLIFVNFFLMFIQQVSMVLFPDLRRRTEGQINTIYERMKLAVQCVFPFVLLAYLPCSVIIQFWLPIYRDSIEYLIFLLPLCCFETKMQLIYNTMFKVKRMERKLFLCNFISLLFSATFFCISIYILQSIECVVISMFATISIRCIIAEYIVERELNLKLQSILSDVLPEITAIVIFVLSIVFFGKNIGFAIYAVYVVIYFISKLSSYKRIMYRFTA